VEHNVIYYRFGSTYLLGSIVKRTFFIEYDTEENGDN
jgi:hypothetical protein